MSSITVDAKGRIIIPEELRKKLGIRKGTKVKVSLKQNQVIITSIVDPKKFIEKMEGCIKEGSRVENVDPLKLKEIWMAG